MKISLNFKTSYCKLKISGLGAKLWVAFLSFWCFKELWCFKAKDLMHFVEQKHELQQKRNGIENEKSIHSFQRRSLCFSSHKNRKLKVKLWWVGVCERKKRAFFVPFILSEGIFFNICVLSYCVVYWIHFQNTHAFPYFLHFYILTSSKTFSVFHFYFKLGVPNVSSILNLKCS